MINYSEVFNINGNKVIIHSEDGCRVGLNPTSTMKRGVDEKEDSFIRRVDLSVHGSWKRIVEIIK